MSPDTRYARQMQLPRFGADGQARLSASRVLVAGCGALGTVVSEALVRAGIGTVTIIDRDLVDLSNLQRQTLFTEQDARRAAPKAEAAKARLAAVNSSVVVRAFVDDIRGSNALGYCEACDLIVDCLDNFETRLVLNDCAVARRIPLVYGGAVGLCGMAAAILPWSGRGHDGTGFGGGVRWSESRATPCLRCLMPEAPTPGETETCDTAGILGPVAGIVASVEAGLAIRLIAEGPEHVPAELVRVDLGSLRFQSAAMSEARNGDCACCAHRRFEFLHQAEPAHAGRSPAACRVLCGRNAVEIRLGASVTIAEFSRIEAKLRIAGEVASSVHGSTRVLRVGLPGAGDGPHTISVLASASGTLAIVDGTRDTEQARSVVARWVGI